MTEEEKKAIEYLKRHIIPCYGNKGRIEFMLNDTLLNLIEKLQKENLLLSAKENMSAYFEFKRNYILKDKIREKIEELDEQQKEWLEDRKLKNSDGEIIFARDVLKELLEEE